MQIETIVIAAAGIIGATVVAWAVNRFLASFPTSRDVTELTATLSRLSDTVATLSDKVEHLAESQMDTRTELRILSARVDHVEKAG